MRLLCRAFNNSIHAAVQTTHAAMDAMLFKEALKHSFFGLLNARNLYLQRCGRRGTRRDLARRYMEVGQGFSVVLNCLWRPGSQWTGLRASRCPLHGGPHPEQHVCRLSGLFDQ